MMTAKQFIQADINKRFVDGEKIHNVHFSGDGWVEQMEAYAKYKADDDLDHLLIKIDALEGAIDVLEKQLKQRT